MSQTAEAQVSIIMGSQSDWDTMRHAHEMLDRFDVPHECRVISAHRTPDLASDYAKSAAGRGVRVIVAGAGGAAHLAGVVAAHTPLPVLGVPMLGWALNGMDALLATVQMPGGVPVGTLSIGKAGAKNAALFAVRILALEDAELREKLRRFHEEETRKVMETELPL
jgi:5-(carboxyamino)imidazole ribonucleotide mutase